MADFKVLIADDKRDERKLVNSQIKNLRPDIETIRVADPEQANEFFNNNREKACSLCIVSDGDMAGANYEDTDIEIPDHKKNNWDKPDFRDLVDYAEEWQKGDSDKKVFVVKRSANITENTSLEKLPRLEINNFQRPFLLDKFEKDPKKFFKEILSHCDKIFALEEKA